MKFIKKNSKYIGIVMICILCSYLTTIATNYIFDSSDVRFDNTGTSLESVNVQDAIDETFHHVTDYNEIKTTIGNSTLTTTNKTLIGAVNEVNSNLGLPSSASGVTGADAFSKINTLNGKKIGSPDYANGYNKQSLNFTATSDGYVQCWIRATEPRLIHVSVNNVEVNRTFAQVISGGLYFPDITPLIYVKKGDTVSIEYEVTGSVGTVYQTREMFYPIR